MSLSDYERAVRTLDSGIAEQKRRQVRDEGAPEDGGVVTDRSGVAEPVGGATPEAVTQFGLAFLTPASRHYHDDDLLDRIERGMAFMARCQRPSGRIDLVDCNFDSAPDTAFGVATLARLAWYARTREDSPEATRVSEALEPYLRSAAQGIADGGFHTPNHRWVVTGALSQVQHLYPDLGLLDTVESYLAETIDINDDGEYTERSHGVYANVVNRHLIDAALALDRPSLLDPVRDSLHTLADFLNHDWTIETSVSQRQDYGRREVPAGGAPNFYWVARRDGDERLAAVARGLLDHGGWERPGVAARLLTQFAREPEWRESDLPTGDREESLSRQMTASGVWRVREGPLSATVAADTSEVLTLSYGTGAVAELCVVSPYFGTGFFRGTEMDFGDGSATVTLERSFGHPHRPGYERPLGRPVPWGSLDTDDREALSLPEFELELGVERIAGGFELHLRSAGGVEQVPFAVEARFPPEGRLEFGESGVPAGTDGPVYLGDEVATYHRDGDAITLGPGWYAHRLSDCPDDPGDALRVLVTDWSPLDRTLAVTAGDWTGGDRMSRMQGGGPAHVGRE